MDDSITQIDPKAANDRAAKAADKIGAINSTVMVCIRSIKMNNSPNAPRGGLDDISKFELGRYLKVPSMKIPFYFATDKRMKEEQRNCPRIGTTEIIETFNAHELASVLALTYLFKRLRSRIKDADEWDRISKTIEEQIEIGSLLGQALPTIGYADGILVGGIRPIALALIYLIDPKGYKEYRRDLKMKKQTYNLNDERERWGVTHIDIASRLLLLCGFGQELVLNFKNGLESVNDKRLSEDELRFRLLGLWIESFAIGAPPPKIRGEEKHQSSSEVLDKLLDDCARIRSSGLNNYWISRGKKDLSHSALEPYLEREELNKNSTSDDIDSAPNS